MRTFTTVEEMANEFTNENIKQLFISSFKNVVERATKKGIDFITANEMAFDFLIRNNAFEKLVIQLAKNHEN